MRILISSNAPWSPTGYGNQVKGLAPGLRALGHQVAVQAWWGLEGGSIELEGIRYFPRHLDGYGNDASPYYCRTWKADLLITLIDLWVLDPGQLGNLGTARWCPYFPIDHADPIPQAIADRFPAAHRLLVYSRYAETQVKAHEGGRYAEKVRYLPHGVDTDTYRPCSEDERLTYRRDLHPHWPPDAFIVGMVAANKGYPPRKSFSEVMEAFAAFVARHPEARLYLHSIFTPDFQGPNLQDLARHYGIAEATSFANPRLLLGGEYDDETMRRFYCTMDVLAAPSQAEGFGLPLVEAQACGVPIITTAHSAMRENTGVGISLPPLSTSPSLILGRLALADPGAIAWALEEVYRQPRSPYRAQIAREFALQFSWPRVLTAWDSFLQEVDAGRRELALELTSIHL